MSNLNLESECLEAGTLLAGRYLIEFVLGRGGMGSVYYARDRAQADAPLAIKQMRVPPETAAQPEIVQQFLQEAKFLYHLDHPGLVKVRDFFEEDGRYYLTMDYLRGKTLAEMLRLQKAPFEVTKVLELSYQLLDVLEYLHQQKPPILFRDLKPGNVMVDSLGKVHLIDFGIARCLVDGQRTATILQGVGSADYCPLEQYQGGGTDQRSDLYALGATLYHLLTLRPPPLASEVALSGRPAPSARKFNPKIPPLLEDVIAKLLELRKENRYHQAAQVRNALQKVQAASAKSKAPSDHPSQARTVTKSRSSFRLQQILLSSLTILVLGLAMWLMTQMNHS